MLPITPKLVSHRFISWDNAPGEIIPSIPWIRLRNPHEPKFQVHPDSLSFVFLEGNSAVGKSTICERLKKTGYTIVKERYVQLCNEHGKYNPAGSLMSMFWVTSLVQHLESLKDHMSTIKDNIVFVDRSFLTPSIYSQDGHSHSHLYSVMEEFSKLNPCHTVVCSPGLDIIYQRLERRFYESTPEQQIIRESLGETDPLFIRNIESKYFDLFDTRPDIAKVFLNTLDTHQAAAALLEYYVPIDEDSNLLSDYPRPATSPQNIAQYKHPFKS